MTAAFVPLHCHSHYSLLDGLSKPAQVAARLAECGHRAAALTDHGGVAGAASFQAAMKGACGCGHQKKSHSATRCLAEGCACRGYEKTPLKAILGCEFNVCARDAADRDPGNRPSAHLCVLARSRAGWRSLVRATTESHRPEFACPRPRLDLDRLAAFAGGQFLAFSGQVGSGMADVFFADRRGGYRARTLAEVRGFLRPDWRRAGAALACRHRDLFGRENFWLEVGLLDADNLPAARAVAEMLRVVARDTGVPCLAAANSHYPRTEDAVDHRVQVCSALEATRQDVERKASAHEDVTLAAFFRSKRYHIPSLGEMEALHTPGELAATLDVAERCEDYEILGSPVLPEFPCPDGLDADATLARLCERGWLQKLGPRTRNGLVHGERADSSGGPGADPVDFPEGDYRDRLTRELAVIRGAGLAGYFLVVQDYCAYARTRGKVGKGRGSAAGSLASYLSGITDVDPLLYGLIFERFYNSGRNTPGRVAYPDIDCDFEKGKREDVIAYCRLKYGNARVAQMATFTRMQGRGALKDVLRVNGAATFEQMNRITETVPDEASVSDHLQEMLEERGESSIIRWTLEHDGDGLKEWCHVGEGGRLGGPLAAHFEQAIRLEGTIRGAGKHPSGLIIAPDDLSGLVPMTYDRSSKEMIVAVDMRDAEAMGLLKFDILGTAVLDKLRAWSELMRTGRMTL